eukprot:Colp12_sorted_trinity150504_noHs@2552
MWISSTLGESWTSLKPLPTNTLKTRFVSFLCGLTAKFVVINIAQRVSSEPSLPLDQPSMTRRCWSWPGTNNIKAPLSSNLSYSLLREKNIELHNMVKRINGFIDQFEERQSELKKALQAEAKEREKALQAEAKEREKALQAEAKEREKALQAEAKEREKALQAEAKEREKALQAEA